MVHSEKLIDVCWRIRGRSTGEELWCAIYDTATGLEVRAAYDEESVSTQPVATVAQARHWARRYRRTLLEAGGFEDVPVEPGGSLAVGHSVTGDGEQAARRADRVGVISAAAVAPGDFQGLLAAIGSLVGKCQSVQDSSRPDADDGGSVRRDDDGRPDHASRAPSCPESQARNGSRPDGD
jgi:hypothetical protein